MQLETGQRVRLNPKKWPHYTGGQLGTVIERRLIHIADAAYDPFQQCDGRPMELYLVRWDTDKVQLSTLDDSDEWSSDHWYMTEHLTLIG